MSAKRLKRRAQTAKPIDWVESITDSDLLPPSSGREHLSTRPREASATKRAGIIAATVRVLTRDGLSETTTRKIAAEAGVNQAMIGYYFGGKDELLLAALQEMMRLTTDIVRATMRERVAPDIALASAIIAFWDHVERNYDLQVMQYELTLYALRQPDSAWLAREQYAGYTALVAKLAREAYETAQNQCAVPYDDLARFIIGGLDGLILQYVSDRDETRARRGLQHLIQAAVALASGTTQSESNAAASQYRVREESDAE